MQKIKITIAALGALTILAGCSSLDLALRGGVRNSEPLTNLKREVQNPTNRKVSAPQVFNCEEGAKDLTFKSLNGNDGGGQWIESGFNTANITSLAVSQTEYSPDYMITIKLNEEGSKDFADLTRNNINRQLGIFVGEKLVSAPYVQQEITGGEAIVTGIQSKEEAVAIADKIC